MPTVTKVGRKWRARANVLGTQISVGMFFTKAEAIAAALEAERKAKLGDLAAARGLIVRDLLERYQESVTPKKRGSKWENARLNYMQRTAWAALPVDKLTPDVLAAWRDERLLSVLGSTVVRDFNLLSDVFNVARDEWRWIAANPLRTVRRPRESEPRTRRLIDGELERLRVASGYRPDEQPVTSTQRVVAAAEFAVETAMRSGEICALRWSDVRGSHVHVHSSKNGTARDVPLSVRAGQIVAQMPRDGGLVFGLTDGSRDALWRKLCDKAMIDGLHFHDLRREATTRLARKFDVLALARITGHKDLRLLMTTYYAPSIGELAERMG